MSIKPLALTHTSGVSIALLLFPAGTRLQVFTKNDAGARTNRLMTVEKEAAEYADWKVIERPKTSDASILPNSFGDDDPVISPRDLADAIMTGDVWAAEA
ncbi:hypothetical protein JF531_07725 [Microbacterium esteraromaticum]|uniref:hypothetical protein n=1 Tax=Microbacterium esteraromaticum TaxID=57043 RepID=UPI001A8E4EAD|nr:hypothetical protein [Microbacterium esteraromaticum]MBN8424409.1 hypothetical protein [Microbacterium esteraromaticum]